MTPTPHRFSIKSVGRYLEVFERVAKSTGDLEICVDPALLGLAPNTVEARIRDAAKAVVRGTVTSPNVAPYEFSLRWKTFKVKQRDNLVYVTNLAEIKAESFAAATDHIDVVIGDQPNAEAIATAYAVLLGTRRMQGTVVLRGFTSAFITTLSEEHDIGVRADENQIVIT